MTKRKVSNPLALAVMCCLLERPMHPYEIAATLRARAKDQSVKLNYGSLYTVVEALTRHGLVEPDAVERSGKRPERTVYRLTSAGHLEFSDWLAELLGTPIREYLQFEAGLSFMPALPPEEVAALLESRVRQLRLEVALIRSALELAGAEMPRLFSLESEYRLVVLEAEMEWVAKLAVEIRAGTLDGIEVWRHFMAEGGAVPSDSPTDRATRMELPPDPD